MAWQGSFPIKGPSTRPVDRFQPPQGARAAPVGRILDTQKLRRPARQNFKFNSFKLPTAFTQGKKAVKHSIVHSLKIGPRAFRASMFIYQLK
jgi:hypothetical protein